MSWVDKANWIEVSLLVTSEQAEAVAEVLGRFTSEGVVIEKLAIPGENLNKVKADDQVRIFGYIFIDGKQEEKKMRLEENLFYLSAIQPLPAPTYSIIKDQNWMAAWKTQYRPLKVGEKLAILPAWADNIYPDRIPVRINPGMAFGTGTHPTTQLCLRIMEKLDLNDKPFFDVGCGSGILSAAAIKLGAKHAYGVDISPSAVASSRENALLNGVKESADFQQGSAADIAAGVFGIRQAPVVAANILAIVILRLLDEDLTYLVEPGGILILSGILSGQTDMVYEKTRFCGFTLAQKLTMDDWVALQMVRS